MGFTFRKRIKIMPGVRMNVSTRGIGASFGGKGLRYSVNSRGQTRTTVGIPGTGMYYTKSRTYHSSAYQRRNQLLKEQRQAQKLEEIRQNQLEVELFENKCDMIKSIHKECETPIDWEEIRNSPPPFHYGQIGPNERNAVDILENYKPGFFSKLFNQAEKKRQALQEKIRKAHDEDLQNHSKWKELVQTADLVLKGDHDTYLKVIEEYAPFEDISEFGSGFEIFTCDEDSGILEVEFEVKSESVIPNEVNSLTKTGRLSAKPMTKTMYYDLQQDYVCSCAIRIARDLFALLPLHTVLVHAAYNQLNTATGYNEQRTLLSVKFDRTTLNNLNVDLIDCSDSMANFPHNMKFLKTKGLQSVKRIQLS